MGQNLIRDLIREKPYAEVVQLMYDKNIAVKEKGDLSIFNYGPGCDFSDPVVCEARGIILDRITKNVVCRGFDKFFNYSEPYASEIDWNTASVQEKVDGSICKMYWYDGEWKWATNGMIDAKDADVAVGLPVKTYMDIIRSCTNYVDIVHAQETLDHAKTYIFELVSPYNRVVIAYREAMLYHIGTRNNETGDESREDIGIIRPKRYPLHTLNECVDASAKLNASDTRVENEGFVVVDGQFRRIKIKTPEYVYLHHALNNHTMTKERVLDLIEDEDFNDEAFLIEFPEYRELFDHYKNELDTAYRRLKEVIVFARKQYDALGKDRKALWLELQASEWKDIAYVGAMGLNDPGTPEEIIKRLRKKKLYELVRDI